MKRTTYSISFYCRQSKAAVKTGLAPIELSIIINGKRVFINLPRKEYPATFKKAISSKRTNQIKEYLEEVRIKFNDVQLDMMKNNIPLSADSLKEYYQNGGIKVYTLSDLFEEYRELLWKRVLSDDLSIKAYDKYRNAFDCFFKTVDKNMAVEDLTPSLIQNFIADCNVKYQPATTNGIVTKIKTVIIYAKDNGKIKTNPFVNIKLHKVKKEIEYLTEEEINKLKTKEITIDRLNKVRDLSVFQLSSGLSYSDMSQLKKEDVQFANGMAYIYKKRMKTGTPYTSVILPDGVKILEKYNYQLPVITNQRLNDYLKEVQKICDIHKTLKTHLFRKSYATLLLNKGVRMETVSKAIGHSSVKISEKYYAQLKTETIIDEIKAVI